MMTMISHYFLSFLFLCRLGTSLLHPGALSTKAELDYIKTQILAGAEPWSGEYNLLISSIYASSLPHGKITVLSTDNNQANSIRDDAFSAYTQALLWYFSGNGVYAVRAIAILDSWKDLQGFISNTDQDKLLAGWTGAVFAPAAEILRFYPGWTASSIAGLQAMFKRAYYPKLNVMSTWNGNVDLTQIDALMAVAVFNDDTDLFNTGLARMNTRIPAYFYLTTDTQIPSIAGDGGNIPQFWSNPAKWVSGLTQETCRDYGHHVQFALGSVLHAMETAWHQGTDVYTVYQERMVEAMELQALMFNTGSMQGVCSGASAPAPSRFNTFEVGYNHYHNRKGISLPNTLQLIVNQIRPNSVRDATGWNLAYETLTHADLQQSLVSNDPAPSPTPAPAPTPALPSMKPVSTAFRPSIRPAVVVVAAPSAKPVPPSSSLSAAPTAATAEEASISRSGASDSSGGQAMTVIIVAAVVAGAVCIVCGIGWLLYLFSAGGETKAAAASLPSISTAAETPSTAIDNRAEKYVAV